MREAAALARPEQREGRTEVEADAAAAWLALFAPAFRRMGEWIGKDLTPFLEEIATERELLSFFEKAVADIDDFREKTWPCLLAFNTFRIGPYVLARALRPQAVVETGVLHGMGSAFILHALRRNGAGRLYSIDLPATKETGSNNIEGFKALLPDGKKPGWMVPPESLPAWSLTLGDSRAVMPALLSEIGTIDMFLHDSRHSREVMESEYAMAWEGLAPGGLLISDNIECDTAFFDFCLKAGQAPFVMPDVRPSGPLSQPKARFGVIVKGR